MKKELFFWANLLIFILALSTLLFRSSFVTDLGVLLIFILVLVILYLAGLNQDWENWWKLPKIVILFILSGLVHLIAIHLILFSDQARNLFFIKIGLSFVSFLSFILLILELRLKVIQFLKNKTGDKLGFGRCPNCYNTWYQKDLSGFRYQGRYHSSGIMICADCLTDPEKNLSVKKVSKNLKKLYLTEKEIQLICQKIKRHKEGKEKLEFF
jgi:hypothetical protein